MSHRVNCFISFYSNVTWDPTKYVGIYCVCEEFMDPLNQWVFTVHVSYCLNGTKRVREDDEMFVGIYHSFCNCLEYHKKLI